MRAGRCRRQRKSPPEALQRCRAHPRSTVSICLCGGADHRLRQAGVRRRLIDRVGARPGNGTTAGDLWQPDLRCMTIRQPKVPWTNIEQNNRRTRLLAGPSRERTGRMVRLGGRPCGRNQGVPVQRAVTLSRDDYVTSAGGNGSHAGVAASGQRRSGCARLPRTVASKSSNFS